jgi:two-component system, response regulator PdtaR
MNTAVANKGRILVVDDDRLVLATVTHGLAQAGYEVIDADNGDDAILLAREHRPVLALLDIRMEGKSGFDVAETLRDAYHIPFLFLSAFADAATRQQVQALGALDYLIKPLEVSQIVPAVEAAMARVRGGQLGAPVAAPPAAPVPAALADPVPLAVGVLMHRYSLPRDQALLRLQRLADEQRQPLAAQAERLLGAVEELARSAV